MTKQEAIRRALKNVIEAIVEGEHVVFIDTQGELPEVDGIYTYSDDVPENERPLVEEWDEKKATEMPGRYIHRVTRADLPPLDQLPPDLREKVEEHDEDCLEAAVERFYTDCAESC